MHISIIQAFYMHIFLIYFNDVLVANYFIIQKKIQILPYNFTIYCNCVVYSCISHDVLMVSLGTHDSRKQVNKCMPKMDKIRSYLLGSKVQKTFLLMRLHKRWNRITKCLVRCQDLQLVSISTLKLSRILRNHFTVSLKFSSFLFPYLTFKLLVLLFLFIMSIFFTMQFTIYLSPTEVKSSIFMPCLQNNFQIWELFFKKVQKDGPLHTPFRHFPYQQF